MWADTQVAHRTIIHTLFVVVGINIIEGILPANVDSSVALTSSRMTESRTIDTGIYVESEKFVGGGGVFFTFELVVRAEKQPKGRSEQSRWPLLYGCPDGHVRVSALNVWYSSVHQYSQPFCKNVFE